MTMNNQSYSHDEEDEEKEEKDDDKANQGLKDERWNNDNDDEIRYDQDFETLFRNRRYTEDYIYTRKMLRVMNPTKNAITWQIMIV
jgi:hypothetical protein